MNAADRHADAPSLHIGLCMVCDHDRNTPLSQNFEPYRKKVYGNSEKCYVCKQSKWFDLWINGSYRRPMSKRCATMEADAIERMSDEDMI